MDQPAPRFRPYIQVLTERSRPEPIFVVAITGTARWLRVRVPIEVLIRSPSQKSRELGALMRAHYAVHERGPFGKVLGYVFHSLPDRATRYSVAGVAEGVITGESASSVPWGVATLRLR